MTRRVTYGRVVATSPGKHGPNDWRVTFAGAAPTLGEAVALVGLLLLAEDRYAAPHHRGRFMFWDFLDRLLFTESPEAVVAVATDCTGFRRKATTMAVAAGAAPLPRPPSTAS